MISEEEETILSKKETPREEIPNKPNISSESKGFVSSINRTSEILIEEKKGTSQ